MSRVIVGVAALLGAAAGLLAAHARLGPARAEDAPLAASPTPTRDVATVRAEAPPRPVVAERPTSEEPSFESARVQLRTALAALPVPGAPPGTGEIRGRVVDANGEPLGGVHVRAQPEPSWISGPDVGAPDASPGGRLDRLLAALDRLRAEQAARASVVTAADGTYRISGLAARPYVIRGWKAGYDVRALLTPSPMGWGVRPDAEVDLQASPAETVTLAVRYADGQVPESAVVRITDSTGSREGIQHVAWSAASPTIRLVHGGYTLQAFGGCALHHRWSGQDHWTADSKSGVVRVGVAPGTPAQPVVVTLLPRGGLRVHLRATSDAEEFDVRVFAKRVEPGAEADSRARWASPMLGVRDAGVGRESFYDLEPGRYRVGVFRAWPAETPDAEGEFEVGTAVTVVELALPPAKAVAQIEVRALDGAGAPIANARFMVHTRRSSSWARSVRVRPDGTYVLRLDADIAADWVARPVQPDRHWSLELKHAAYEGGATVSIAPDSPMPIEIRLGALATLEIEFPDFANGPYAQGACCRLAAPGTDLMRLRMELTMGERTGRSSGPDGEGRQALGPVEPGTYELVIFLKDPARPGPFGWSVSARTPITLQAGRNAYTVPAPVRYEVTVHAEGVDGKQLVLAASPGGGFGPPAGLAMVEGGRAVFREISPGRYWIGTWGMPAEQQLEFRVPDQTVVVFRVREGSDARK